MIEIDFHNNKYLKELSEFPVDLLSNPRLRILDHFTRTTNSVFTGKILDSGCGNGYAGISIALNYSVKKVISLDSSNVAVNELIPKYSKHYGVRDLIEPMVGDFSSINFVEEFDYIIAFGSLHHSPCLFSTLKALTESLKFGGYLIAHEPVMPDTTTHQYFIDKYDQIEKKYGLTFRHGDRYDRFYRNSEYISAGILNGLNLIFSDIFSLTDATLRKDGLVNKVFYFKKEKITYTPHLWKPLDTLVSSNET